MAIITALLCCALVAVRAVRCVSVARDSRMPALARR